MEDYEENNEVFSFCDEDGNEVELYYADTVKHGGKTYAVFFDTPDGEEAEQEEDEDGNVIIFRCETAADGTADYVTPDSDEELNAVFALFLEQYGGEE